jgi:hypothetical protein
MHLKTIDGLSVCLDFQPKLTQRGFISSSVHEVLHWPVASYAIELFWLALII